MVRIWKFSVKSSNKTQVNSVISDICTCVHRKKGSEDYTNMLTVNISGFMIYG